MEGVLAAWLLLLLDRLSHGHLLLVLALHHDRLGELLLLGLAAHLLLRLLHHLRGLPERHGLLLDHFQYVSVLWVLHLIHNNFRILFAQAKLF